MIYYLFHSLRCTLLSAGNPTCWSLIFESGWTGCKHAIFSFNFGWLKFVGNIFMNDFENMDTRLLRTFYPVRRVSGFNSFHCNWVSCWPLFTWLDLLLVSFHLIGSVAGLFSPDWICCWPLHLIGSIASLLYHVIGPAGSIANRVCIPSFRFHNQ